MSQADPQDCYRLLGVEPGAGPDEIKRAYKRMAARLHPDRHPGDTGARARFEQLANAYRVLADPVSRARYDRTRRVPRPRITEAPAAGTSWRDGLTGFVDNYRREAGPRPRAGRDLLYRLRLDLVDAVRGGTFAIQAPRCGRVSVEVPPDTSDGTRLVLAGRGEPGTHGGRPGDLLVEVEIVAHPLFRRRGFDLAFSWPVPLPAALLGDEVTVPTLEGSGRLRVPRGTRNGQVLRVAGLGLPRPGGQPPGDLLVTVEVELPVECGSEVRKLAGRMAEALDEHHFPRVREARRRHLP